MTPSPEGIDRPGCFQARTIAAFTQPSTPRIGSPRPPPTAPALPVIAGATDLDAALKPDGDMLLGPAFFLLRHRLQESQVR